MGAIGELDWVQLSWVVQCILHKIWYLVFDTLNVNNPMKASDIECKCKH